MPKILIVDDDATSATSRRLYTSLLIPYGHCVLEARDGQEGLSIAQSENPDLIVCDIIMPTIKGVRICSTAQKPSAPSAHSGDLPQR